MNHHDVVALFQVSGLIGEISGASAEQAQGIAAIGEAIGAMDGATRDNAALVEDAALAIGVFRVDDAETA